MAAAGVAIALLEDEPALAELVEAARLAVAASHAPEGGVAVDGDRELVFVLPEGVAWSAAATTRPMC